MMRRCLNADSRRHLAQSSQILPLDTGTFTGQRHHPVLQLPITQFTKFGIGHAVVPGVNLARRASVMPPDVCFIDQTGASHS